MRLDQPEEPGQRQKGRASPHCQNADAILAMLFHLLSVTIVIVGVLVARAAAEEWTPTARQACLADYQRLCSSVAPGRKRVKECMLSHVDELSPECRAALQAGAGR